MNIGIRLHDTAEGTLSQRLGFAKAQGFSCAHLAMSKALKGFAMDEAPALLTDELAARVRDDFARQGMECAVLGCYLSLTNTREEERAKVQEIYRAHLRFAKKIGAGVVGTETPPARNLAFSQPAPQSEEAFQLFISCLSPVVRWAEEEDAVIAIEPVFSHIVSTPEKAERMLTLLHSDHLRIILDAVNLLSPETVNKADEIIAEAICRLGDKVSVLHMKDYLAVKPGDVNLESVACGTGLMKYERLLSFGKKHNLPMTLENTVPENAQAAREYLEKIAAGL